MEGTCFNCDELGSELYGFTICDPCKKNLRLFTKKTLSKHSKAHSKSVYEEDVKRKLAGLENIYAKQKIKLLDILYKLNHDI